MKIKTSGFTLVELMIVIAIIGILAAALFPSMTNYLKRSRDAARQSNMRDIGVALGTFYADQGKYPNANAGCIVYGANGASGQFNSGAYMEKGVPKDPNRTANENGCANGNYGYTTPKINGGASGYLLVSALENVNGGNTASGVAAIISTTNFIPTSLKQGAGSGYILPN